MVLSIWQRTAAHNRESQSLKDSHFGGRLTYYVVSLKKPRVFSIREYMFAREIRLRQPLIRATLIWSKLDYKEP